MKAKKTEEAYMWFLINQLGSFLSVCCKSFANDMYYYKCVNEQIVSMHEWINTFQNFFLFPYSVEKISEW